MIFGFVGFGIGLAIGLVIAVFWVREHLANSYIEGYLDHERQSRHWMISDEHSDVT